MLPVEAERKLETPPLFATAADGHYEVKLCEAVLQSSRRKSWVKVPS